MERPVKESETFLSFAGHLDKRVDLDKNIKHGDSRYYSALSVMAAKVAYENKAFVENAVRNHWKVNGVKTLKFYAATPYTDPLTRELTNAYNCFCRWN